MKRTSKRSLDVCCSAGVGEGEHHLMGVSYCCCGINPVASATVFNSIFFVAAVELLNSPVSARPCFSASAEE